MVVVVHPQQVNRGESELDDRIERLPRRVTIQSHHLEQRRYTRSEFLGFTFSSHHHGCPNEITHRKELTDPAVREGISEMQVLQVPWKHPTEQRNHRWRHIRWQASYKSKQILQGWEHTPSRGIEPKHIKVLVPTSDGEQTKRLATTDKLRQCREEVRVSDVPSDFCHPNGETTEEREGFCVGPENRRSDTGQLTRQTEGLELVPIGKDLIEGIPFEDTPDVKVGKVPDGNEGGGVAPRTMLDGQRPDLSLEVLEEFVEVRCLSTLCGESEILQMSKLGEGEFSSPIGRSDSKS